jgi:integrase
VIGARWNEINLAERLWTMPPGRMKASKEHRVPLLDAALAIISRMGEIRSGDHVFPGAKVGRPLSNMAFLMLLRRMGHADLTANGFRSTFRFGGRAYRLCRATIRVRGRIASAENVTQRAAVASLRCSRCLMLPGTAIP